MLFKPVYINNIAFNSSNPFLLGSDISYCGTLGKSYESSPDIRILVTSMKRVEKMIEETALMWELCVS